MLQSFGGRFGRLILGDTPHSPMQEVKREQASASARAQASASTSAGMGERPAPQPAERLMSMLGSPSAVYEGVPVAQRPRHQQISCMTCNQTLEPDQRQFMCHVCSSWMHENCIETLKIGSKWNADMCSTCQQNMTRQLRVVSAQEVRKGRPWNQDEWFHDLRGFVKDGTGYGISRNKDMNELELTLARALQSGIHNYRDAHPASTTDGETAGTDDLREQPGEPTPVATATAPLWRSHRRQRQVREPQRETHSLIVWTPNNHRQKGQRISF